MLSLLYIFLTNQIPVNVVLLTHNNAGDVRAQRHGAGHIRDKRQGASVPLPPAAGPLRRRGGRGPADGAQPRLPRHHLTQGKTSFANYSLANPSHLHYVN